MPAAKNANPFAAQAGRKNVLFAHLLTKTTGNSYFFSCNFALIVISFYGKRTCVCFVRLPEFLTAVRMQ